MTVPGSFDRGSLAPAERQALFEALVVVLGAMNKAGMLGPAVRLTDAPPPPFGIGATGPLVVVWQKVVGAVADGQFGPKTEAATVAWAQRAGFGPRKTVEPAMWSLAVGLTVGFLDGAAILPSGERIDLAGAATDARSVLSGS